MVSFSLLDISIIIIFFIAILFIGFGVARNNVNSSDEFLLGGRKLNLILFILTSVSTWYGGILGVGEFTYRFGIVSWFAQGFPYYIFAFLFAIFFAKKIRNSNLITIPEKLLLTYGKKVSLLASVFIFILASPAPYLLMTANLVQLIFQIPIIYCLIFSAIISASYLFVGGYKSDVWTDVFLFFIMFIGFIIFLVILFFNFGGVAYLKSNLPLEHLQFTGNVSPVYLAVWFLIALWTFADPGFHQRTNAAKNSKVAFWGILISIFFWALFDFLTTSVGLYSKAVLPNIDQPSLAYTLLAEKVLSPGIKGIFFIALLATIISTLNSFLFISATTISKDFLFVISKEKDENKLKKFTLYGLIFSSVISIVIAYFVPSVIQIWYYTGSFCIPGLILIIIGAYYPNLKVKNVVAFFELLLASAVCVTWFFIKEKYFKDGFLSEIEPMIAGLLFAFAIHITSLLVSKTKKVSLLS